MRDPYSPESLRDLLPIAMEPGVLGDLPEGPMKDIVVDVRRAFDRLNGWHSMYTYQHLVDEVSYETLSQLYDIPAHEVRSTVERSLGHMSEFLGGDDAP